jgi:hypothetical protein
MERREDIDANVIVRRGMKDPENASVEIVVDEALARKCIDNACE